MNRHDALKVIAAVGVGAGIAWIYQQENVGHQVYLPLVIGKPQLKVELGYAVQSGNVTNPIVSEANVVAIESEYTMQAFRPSRYDYQSWGIDQIVNGFPRKIHFPSPCWHIYNPDWFVNLPSNQAEAVLDESINYTVNRWGSNIYSWDVCNESYAVSPMTPSPWKDKLGSGYVTMAYEKVAEALPDVKRIYNSFFFDQGDRDNAISLLESGLIHGVGHQFHLAEGSYSEYPWLYDFADYIHNAGGELYFSECGVWASNETKQAQMWRQLAEDAVQVGAERLVVWGVHDPAWRGDVTLHRQDGTPKPSYYEVMEVIE